MRAPISRFDFTVGGVVEDSSHKWWIRDGASTPIRQEAVTKPTSCPPLAASISRADGVGPAPPPREREVAGFIGGSGSLFLSISPEHSVQGYETLGRFLGEMFSGPGYRSINQSVGDSLQSIRTNLGEMDNRLRQDTNFVKHDYTTALRPAMEQDTNALQRSTSSRLADEHKRAAELRTALGDAHTAAVDYDATAVGHSIDALGRGTTYSKLQQEIDPDRITPAGPDLIPGMSELRGQIYGKASEFEGRSVQKAAKISNALAQSSGSNAQSLRMAQRSLDVAQALAAMGAGKTVKAAELLLQEAQSRRLAAAGFIKEPSVAVWNKDGSMGSAPLSMPGSAGRSIADNFAAYQVQKAVADTRLNQLRSIAADANQSEQGRNVASRAVGFVGYSDIAARSALISGDMAGSKLAMEMAISVADFAIDVTLALTVTEALVGKLAYEAITGTRLLDGATLSKFDRSLAAINMLTLGFGSEIAAGIQAMSEIGVAATVTNGLSGTLAEARKFNLLARELAASEPVILRSAVIEAREFATTKRLAEHIRHLQEFGFTTEGEYLAAARKFGRSESIDIMALVRRDTNVVKWNFYTD